MDAPQYVPPAYPVLGFIARVGIALAIVVALLVGGVGTMLALVLAQWWLVPVAIVVAVLVGGLLASYVEIVRIVLDTLVPR